MASDAKVSHRRMPRSLRFLLLALIGVLLLLLVLATWLITTSSGARAVFSLLPETVKVTGADGNLLGPLRFDKLVVDTEGQQLTFSDVRLAWHPRALLDRRLHVESLHAGHLAVVTKPEKEEKEAPALPDSIGLPMQLQLERFRIDSGEVVSGAATLVELGVVDLRLAYDGARYQLGIDRLDVGAAAGAQPASASISGEASLATTKPYPLDAHISTTAQAQFGEDAFKTAGGITVSGSLKEIVLEPDLTVNEASLTGRAVLHPFSEQVLGPTLIEARGVNLSALKADLPPTRINLQLKASELGAGELVLHNAEAGPYNEGKLPLSDLRLVFREDAKVIHFEQIRALLGSTARPAGAVSGSGRHAGGVLNLSLATDQLNLKRVDERMQATQLAGTVELQHSPQGQEVNLDLREPIGQQQMLISAEAVATPDAVEIKRAEVQIGSSRAAASGRVELGAAQSFAMTGQLHRFRPGDLGDFEQLPEMLLNGDFSLEGKREPQLNADLSFQLSDSQLAGHAMQGEGRLELRGDNLDVPRLVLSAGANRLNVEGQLSQTGGQLQYAVDAPKLEQFGKQFAGALKLNGTARGSFSEPRVEASWTANGLRLFDQLQIDATQGKADLALDRSLSLPLSSASVEGTARGVRSDGQEVGELALQLQFAPRQNAPLRLSLTAEDLQAGGLEAQRLNVKADGTTAAHSVAITLAEKEQDWSLQANGGISNIADAPQWRGNIRAFDAAGRFSGRLTAPAPLFVSQKRVQLERFRFDAKVGYIAIEQFRRDADGIVTRGHVERIQAAELLRFSSPDPAFSTDLQLSGDWEARITDQPSGLLRIRRDSGDVVMLGETSVPLGLSQLEASARAGNGKLSVQLRAEGRQLGVIEGSGSTTIGSGTRFGVAQNAPVTGQLRLEIPSLGWVGPLVSPTLVASGRLESAVTLSGTVSKPDLSGQIRGTDLGLLFTDTGLDLRNGRLESSFQGSQLVVNSLRFGQEDSYLDGSGRIDFSGAKPVAEATIYARRFQLLDSADRRLRLSGASEITWREGKARIDGAFRVDSGFFDIGSSDAPRLSDDVVVVGRGEGEQGEQRGFPANVDISVSLGDGVALRGRGLKGTLVGDIRLRSKSGEPLRAVGTLRIRDGTFAAYGRELAIEQGVLRFNGPLDNPSLDILAMRRGQEVEAGVAVRGTVLAPRVSLVSEPPLSEAEKLSWLVLGRGPGSAGEGDLDALRRAAGSLLTQGAAAGVQSRIASAIGVDELSLGKSQGNLQERIVTIGKQVSSRLYVSFERGLETALSVLHLRYTLTPRLTLEAEAGSRSAVSVFYNIAFD